MSPFGRRKTVSLSVCTCLSAGRLCLSLDKDSFQVLGVEGKPSRFNHRTNSRYGLDTVALSLMSHAQSSQMLFLQPNKIIYKYKI